MTENTTATITSKQDAIVAKIIAACDKAEHKATAHYIDTGKLCYQFVTLYTNDGGKRKDGVDILKGKLSEAGLRNLDISTYIKSYALSTLSDSVKSLPVSCMIALLPVCNAKGDEPSFVDGVSKADVEDTIARVNSDHIPATKLRTIVDNMLGKEPTAEKKDWEKLVAVLNKADDKSLAAALRNNGTLRERLEKMLAKLQAAAEAKDNAEVKEAA